MYKVNKLIRKVNIIFLGTERKGIYERFASWSPSPACFCLQFVSPAHSSSISKRFQSHFLPHVPHPSLCTSHLKSPHHPDSDLSGAFTFYASQSEWSPRFTGTKVNGAFPLLFNTWYSFCETTYFYLFTPKGGFATKLWPNKLMSYKFISLNLNLVKNPPLMVNK